MARTIRLCALVFLPAFLNAQAFMSESGPPMTGFYFSVRYVNTPDFTLRWDGFDSMGPAVITEQFDGGGGFGMDIGWGITEWLTIKGGFELTSHDVQGTRYNNGSTSYYDLGVRLQLPSPSISPFVALTMGGRGFGMRNSNQQGNVIFLYSDFTGTDVFFVSYGAGVRFWLFEVAYMYGSAAHPADGVHAFATGRIQVGFSAWISFE